MNKTCKHSKMLQRAQKSGARGMAAFVLAAGFLAFAQIAAASAPAQAISWQPFEISLTARGDCAWWEFPVRATFQRQGSKDSLTVEGFWDGERRWVVRAALPQPGLWIWRTESADGGLAGQTGQIEIAPPSPEQIRANSNFRGQIRIAPGGRYFEYADGTPFFLLADTLWAGNTARCGLAPDGTGPFADYLADRKSKNFTAVLMQLIHGYGDYPDGQAHRNEGGYAFFDRDPARLNPQYFQMLDRRMRYLWEQGFVAATPTMWWGKTQKPLFTPDDARRLSAYCAVRYGAFNTLWCLSGEYQYNFRDNGWKPADITAIGIEMQRHNPFRRPLSIHPSGQINMTPPHNVQSSRPFHGGPWIDHHWLQTGQSLNRMFNIVGRLAENRALEPPMPVFCSEAWYEIVGQNESAYYSRWQAWTAFLNGAAGYGYGAQGLWQFYDPNDPKGESGKTTDFGRFARVTWQEALRLPGSACVGHTRTLLTSLEWHRLEPRRDALEVDGKPNPLPTATDLTPPHAAVIAGRTWVIYLPRGNANRSIALREGPAGPMTARWFDPRSGQYAGEAIGVAANAGAQPARPDPAGEDWVLVLTPESKKMRKADGIRRGQP
ncbi:MAG: DUF4038 domain-containing protein [Candidatus Sumerlaeia bacterium]|nr:DUF4038 domain-containing protein [Candidatus Sumerlaeia bacterium]